MGARFPQTDVNANMNIISDIWGSYSSTAQEHSGADIVDRLCDRVATSTLLEDRRDAVRSLKSLAADYHVEVRRNPLGVDSGDLVVCSRVSV